CGWMYLDLRDVAGMGSERLLQLYAPAASFAKDIQRHGLTRACAWVHGRSEIPEQNFRCRRPDVQIGINLDILVTATKESGVGEEIPHDQFLTSELKLVMRDAANGVVGVHHVALAEVLRISSTKLADECRRCLQGDAGVVVTHVAVGEKFPFGQHPAVDEVHHLRCETD